MQCSYFRYIDLEKVYEQIEDYSFSSIPNLANIQYQFGDTLSSIFEDLAHIAFEHCEEDPWTIHPAIDVAAEVGDIIESELEKMADSADVSAPNKQTSPRDTIAIFSTMTIYASFDKFDYWQKQCLIACQYDFLCRLYNEDKIEEAFEVYELILKATIALSSEFVISAHLDQQAAKQSELARARAAQRHAASNKAKAEILQEWQANKREYKSRADFCRIISQRDALLYRTVYEWVAQYDKHNA